MLFRRVFGRRVGRTQVAFDGVLHHPAHRRGALPLFDVVAVLTRALGTLPQIVPLHVGQHVVEETTPRGVRVRPAPRLVRDRKTADAGRHFPVVGPRLVVDRQGHLLEVVGALGAGGGLAHLLHGGDQQADQDGDDRNHDQQLDQGESSAKGVGSHDDAQ